MTLGGLTSLQQQNGEQLGYSISNEVRIPKSQLWFFCDSFQIFIVFECDHDHFKTDSRSKATSKDAKKAADDAGIYHYKYAGKMMSTSKSQYKPVRIFGVSKASKKSTFLSITKSFLFER
ncbi:hypothetical protein [Yersinia sp. 2545 StPb PI]|uniref:hypothetical protein n=1 Tax=Yersinia sp. 2545 StPb PI TaxID=3117410 RepID=UPI003FA41AAD